MGFSFSRAPAVKNVVVLGGSYGGLRAARLLAEQLEGMPNYRVIVIERNSHMNHLYALPRFSVLPGHEYKAFIPYIHVFTGQQSRHLIVQANVISMTNHSVTIAPIGGQVDRRDDILSSLGCVATADVQTIPFEYCIYALGASLPDPINVWKPWKDVDAVQGAHKADTSGSMSRIPLPLGSKISAVRWLQHAQQQISALKSLIIVGGGALGIQLTSDIAELYPGHSVTLIHSREQLMPLYDVEVHEECLRRLKELNVQVILNDRLDLDSVKHPHNDEKGRHVVKTLKGHVFAADAILLCTGTVANTRFIVDGLGQDVVNQQNGLIRVLPSLQVTRQPSTAHLGTNSSATLAGDMSFGNIFAVGDGEVAARNIFKLIKDGPSATLEDYVHGPPAIKVSLGRRHYVVQEGEKVYAKDDGVDDLHVGVMWTSLGFTGEFDMHQ
ncbi:SubName: Full=Uncharacterized protein {ECO:0000313/EMBL:CCA77728.1} [Serendipita indica DSM 11827]|nr:SubName: Full=Uncharacterized protein {ECO:0000313/EMBL:CCA77728.1} [Serendipita indica DSM 11827]